MSCMKREILREAAVQCMEESTVISSTHTLKVLPLSALIANACLLLCIIGV